MTCMTPTVARDGLGTSTLSSTAARPRQSKAASARRRTLGLVASLCLLVSACGGGSDDPGEELVVTFDYPQETRVQLFAPILVQPTLDGLAGHTPTIGVTPSLGGSMPMGLTANSRTGAVSGTATQPGQHLFAANLTARGVEGNLTASFSIVVESPIRISYPSTAPTLSTGQSLAPAMPSVTGLEPGDTVAFAPSPTMQLPAGVAIDPATGAISGTPSVSPGTHGVFVRATVTRNGLAAAFSPAGYFFVVR